MKTNVNQILERIDRKAYPEALALCNDLIDEMQGKFIEELTVNTATDYVGIVILYSKISAMMKKPWKAFPKLEAARGALRFLKDFMSDSDILGETYCSFGEAYAYGAFLPEAVSCFADAARYFDSEEKALDALSSAFFYQERIGKKVPDDLSFAEEKFGKDKIGELKKNAREEVKAQILTDPVESTDDFLKIRFELEEITDELLSENREEGPFCALYWNTKKSVLKDKFGIEWKSPADMNPNIRFY